MGFDKKVAIVYQAAVAPERNGIIKPMKPGGYSDSGADIAYSLKKQGIAVIYPVAIPDIARDLDWVYPDTVDGIQDAIDKGADIIWLNTVLYERHPIEIFLAQGILVVGQVPSNTDLYDDKLVTNDLLRYYKLSVPNSVTITKENSENYTLDFNFPVVVKPIRGRGSQGVSLVKSKHKLDLLISEMFKSNEFGSAIYVEEFLSGQEITITVMPPGRYILSGQEVEKEDYWSLPPVRRFNHQNGIAPYNGAVAVIKNSEILSISQINEKEIRDVCKQCELASKLVGAKAPIRIDCRSNSVGKYFMFDLNMKPNMTGPSRPHRMDQDSLTALAARGIGWSFDELIFNILLQNW
ncbi:ATP-grasp domain-containing protein [Sphingobacterium multivorum]|uniref:ATP-grasp domain-containing protein n=1 Tax=Sphingobacterium multivorum TaxID=28454 RepID=UPI00301745F9